VTNAALKDPCCDDAELVPAVMASAATNAPINAATIATEFLRTFTCPPYE
jgi:hypothetical protein